MSGCHLHIIPETLLFARNLHKHDMLQHNQCIINESGLPNQIYIAQKIKRGYSWKKEDIFVS